MPDYTVKNIKSFMGTDMPGYNATLYCDGKAVADVINDGGGGETDIHWKDYKQPSVSVPWKNYKDEPFTINCTPEEAKLYEFLRGKTWSMPEIDSKVHQHEPDTYIGELVEDVENQKRITATHKRWIKTKVVIKLKDAPEGTYRTFTTPFTKKSKDFIVNKYGDQIEYFLNEKYGQNAI
jgi:hypothetical protein